MTILRLLTPLLLILVGSVSAWSANAAAASAVASATDNSQPTFIEAGCYNFCQTCSDCPCNTDQSQKGEPKSSVPGSSSAPPNGSMMTPDSYVNNILLNFSHRATDYHTPTAVTAGCAPCGSGTPGGGLAGLTFQRFHHFRDMTETASLGPAVFNNHDLTLRVSGYDGTTLQPTAFRFYDPERAWGGNLQPRAGSPGVFDDPEYATIRDLRLYAGYHVATGVGTAVAAGYTLKQVTHAVMTRHDGSRSIFEIVDIDTRQGLDPDWQHPVSALPAGSVTAFGMALVGFGSSKMARYDNVEVYSPAPGNALLYREIFPSDGVVPPTTAGLLAEGWQAISDGVTGPVGIVQQTVGDPLPAVDSNPVGTLPGYFSYLQGGQGNQAVYTTELTGLTVATFARLRVQAQIQGGSTLPVRVLVKVGTQWYVAGNGPTTGSGWVQQDIALSSVTAWYPTTLTTSMHRWEGRLVKQADRNGYGTTLTYPAIQPNSSNSRYRQYQSVTDAHGAMATVTWNPAQVGGQWVIASGRLHYPARDTAASFRSSVREFML